VWRFRLTLVESAPLLDRRQLEAAHLHPRAEVGGRLPQRGALVAAPEAVVDHDVGAELEGAQPDLDEPSFDHVLGRRRIPVPVESLHPIVLREPKGPVLDLYPARGSGLPVPGSPTVRNSVGRVIVTSHPSERSPHHCRGRDRLP
jgi:hypothetical protein